MGLLLFSAFSFARPLGPLDRWNLRNIPVHGISLNSVAFGADAFVAVGSGGKVLYSREGLDWVSYDAGTTHALYGVAYGSGFRAVGARANVADSSSGIGWASATPQSGTNTLKAVTMGWGTPWNGTERVSLWAAVGDQATLLIGSSGTLPAPIFVPEAEHNSFTGVAIGPGSEGPLNVIVGRFGMILTAGDLQGPWTKRSYGGTGSLYGVTFGAGKYVAVGASGLIVTSADGVTWTKVPASSIISNDAVGNLRAVTYGGGYFVAVGDAGNILTSPDDGVTWIKRHSGYSLGTDFFSVAYGKGTFVVVGFDTDTLDAVILQSDPLEGSPPGIPVVTTLAATNILQDSATLNGELVDPGHYCDWRRFQYRPIGSSRWIDTAPEYAYFFSGRSTFSFELKGVTPGQAYEFKALAHNSYGWAEGQTLTFTTAIPGKEVPR